MKIAIIGAGIIGSAIAREIRKRDLADVLVFEKEHVLGEHASGRNSGVIHSGINQHAGTLKARLCVTGNAMLRAFCKERGVPFKQCGTYVVARNRREEQILNRIYLTGIVNHVPNLEIITGRELSEREPAINGNQALFSPTGSTVDSIALVNRVASEASTLGAEYHMGTRVLRITKNRLLTTRGDFHYNHVMNCAGLHADKYAHQMGVGLSYTIIPFKGEYLRVAVDLKTMAYQTPDLRYPFLGVHLTRMIDGRVLAGPTASLALGREMYNGGLCLTDTLAMIRNSNFIRMMMNTEFLKLVYDNARISFSPKAFLDEINSLLDEPITLNHLMPAQSGIRAQIVDRQGRLVNDMIVESTENSTHVLNAVSPGMTCSLAFAKYVVDRVQMQVKATSHKSSAYVRNLPS